MVEAGLVWAARVERWKIRRLYESEAAGRLDEDLLEDVGVGLWARCDSIVTATEGASRQAGLSDVRPAAVNVIEGKLRDVMALLDELAGFGSTPGQVSWRRRAPQSVFGRHVAAKAAKQGD